MLAAQTYANLVERRYVSETKILHVLDQFGWRFEKKLHEYTQPRQQQWLSMSANLTWRWVSQHIYGLHGVDPRIADNVVRSLDFRMGPYNCLLKAEDTLAHKHIANARVQASQDLDTCIPIVLILYWWMARIAPPRNVDTLYRVEEHARGWALQWREHDECLSRGRSRVLYDLSACRHILLTPGKLLTLDGMITYAGDVNRHVHVNPKTGNDDPNGVPWIWTWLPPARYHHLRWIILPPEMMITSGG